MANGSRYPSLTHRLMANSYADPETGCWIWLGRVSFEQYPLMSMRVPGKRHPMPKWAHRVAYETLKGPIPEGAHIDHTCNCRRCINPDHLVARAVDKATGRRKKKPAETGHDSASLNENPG